MKDMGDIMAPGASQVKLAEVNEPDSDFSASFYGPMYASDDEEKKNFEPDHRYYYCRETHSDNLKERELHG